MCVCVCACVHVCYIFDTETVNDNYKTKIMIRRK